MLNRDTFFAYARRAPFGGRLSQAQVDGCNASLDFWERVRGQDLRILAYILATDFHESGGTMQPVRETFAKSDAEAAARLEKAWQAGKLPWVKSPYWRKDKDGKYWFGRGKPQVTHKANYARVGKAIGVDLVANPDLLLRMDVATRAMFTGMINGLFTGRKLTDYFNATTDDPVGARAVVNGSEKARLIASYHAQFLGALTHAAAAGAGGHVPDVEPGAAVPDDVPPEKSKSLWTVGASALGGLVTSVIGAVNNPWAFGAIAFLVVAAGVGAWLVLTGRIEIRRT